MEELRNILIAQPIVFIQKVLKSSTGCSGKTHQDTLFWHNVYCCVTQQLPTRCQLHLCWYFSSLQEIGEEERQGTSRKTFGQSIYCICPWSWPPCVFYSHPALPPLMMDSLTFPCLLGHLNDENQARQCAIECVFDFLLHWMLLVMYDTDGRQKFSMASGFWK